MESHLNLVRKPTAGAVPEQAGGTSVVGGRLMMLSSTLRDATLKTTKAFMKQFAPRSIINAQPQLKKDLLRSYNAVIEGGGEHMELQERFQMAGERARRGMGKAWSVLSVSVWGLRGRIPGVKHIEGREGGDGKRALGGYRLIHGDDKVLLQEASQSVGLAPPWNAPKFVWRYAWGIHNFMVTHVLHRFDPCKPQDHCVNLSVLWWKAITGNRKGSATDDQGVAYDMLPDVTRTVVAWPWVWLYPNLHSQNVAIRTVFLNRLVEDEIKQYHQQYGEGVNVVTLGAGFDTRSVSLASKAKAGTVTCAEVDLPCVVKQKKKMLETHLLRRRPHLAAYLPTLIARDLNDVDSVVQALTRLDAPSAPTIFVVEAVCMYLQDERVADLLQGCVGAAMLKGSPAVSVCFADRFPSVAGRRKEQGELEATRQLFRQIGMELRTYQGKPGRARSMGCARAQFHEGDLEGGGRL